MPSVKYGFTGKNVAARQWAEKHVTKKLVKRITGESKAMIRALIVRSIAEGIPPYEAARQIRSMVGLTRPQAGAVSRFRARLMGRGLSSASVNKQVDRYIKKNIRRRAETIARTEVMDALSGGQQASMQQAQSSGYLGNDAKKRWLASPLACKICSPLAGSTRKVNESWDTSLGKRAHPTVHPNCRCTIMPIPGKGIPATPAERQAIASAGLGTKVPITPSGQIQNGAEARQAILAHQESAEMRALVKEIERLQELHGKQVSQLATKHFEVNQKAFRKFRESMKPHSKMSPEDIVEFRARKLGEFKNKEAWLRQAETRERKMLLETQRGQIQEVNMKIHDSIHENFLFNPTEQTRVTFQQGKLATTSPTPHVMSPQASLDRATRFFRRTVDDELYTTTIVRNGTTAQVERVAMKEGYDIKLVNSEVRGHAKRTGHRSTTTVVDMETTTIYEQQVMVHELSHTIEFANVDVMTEAVRLRRGMTFAEKKAMRLSKSTGNKDYDKFREVSYQDNAKTIQNPDGVGSPYQWKTYSDHDLKVPHSGKRMAVEDLGGYQQGGINNMTHTARDGWEDATEVVTKGMEKMFASPAKLAYEEPQLFDFIYERIIRRKFTHQTSKYAVDPTKALRVPKAILEKKNFVYPSGNDFGLKITGNYFEIDEAVFVKF